jgi:hypothetical protein
MMCELSHTLLVNALCVTKNNHLQQIRRLSANALLIIVKIQLYLGDKACTMMPGKKGNKKIVIVSSIWANLYDSEHKQANKNLDLCNLISYNAIRRFVTENEVKNRMCAQTSFTWFTNSLQWNTFTKVRT